MTRCQFPGCGGVIFSEPIDEPVSAAAIGSMRTQRKVHEACLLCGRSPDDLVVNPLPLVADRFLSAGGR